MVKGLPTQKRSFEITRDITHATSASLCSSHAHTHRSSCPLSHCGRRRSRTPYPLQPDRHTGDARRLFRHRLPSTSQAPSVIQVFPTPNSHNSNTTTNGTPTAHKPMSLHIWPPIPCRGSSGSLKTRDGLPSQPTRPVAKTIVRQGSARKNTHQALEVSCRRSWRFQTVILP